MKIINKPMKKRGQFTIFYVLSIILASVIFSIFSTIAFAQTKTSTKETFPKLAGYNIGAKNYDDPSYQADIAKLDLVILGFYKGWKRNGQSIRDAVRAIKSINPNILIGQYTVLNESNNDPNNTVHRDKYDKLSAEIGPNGRFDWWARDKDGNPLGSYRKTWNTNITSFTRPDTQGDRYPQWLAKRDYAVLFQNVPEFDIWYFDNAFFRPRTRPDWDGDGINDDRDDPAVRKYYRQAMADHWAAVRTLHPNAILIGNVDGNPYEKWGGLREAEYTKRLDGALIEGLMGKTWSIETHGSWEKMMEMYRTNLENVATPNLVLFHVHGEATQYSLMRYGLTSSLLDNGYYIFTPTNYSNVYWFDEFDINLGKAITSPQLSPWQKGVYRRDFENGIALVNPKGNGTQTITLESGFKRLLGTQDPVHNNGKSVTTLTLNDRDGIVLVREAGIAPTPNSADLNSDGRVDVTDLGILLSSWGGGGSADINNDGVVDVVDLGVMLSGWT